MTIVGWILPVPVWPKIVNALLKQEMSWPGDSVVAPELLVGGSPDDSNRVLRGGGCVLPGAKGLRPGNCIAKTCCRQSC
jgi:hypothetical protein